MVNLIILFYMLSPQSFANSLFDSYLSSFKSEAMKEKVQIETNQIKIEFFPLNILTSNPDTYCYCDFINKRIYINNLNWTHLDSLEKEVVIYHELAHCLLGRTHNSNNFSIMTPELISSEFYHQYKSILITELFSQTEFGKLETEIANEALKSILSE